MQPPLRHTASPWLTARVARLGSAPDDLTYGDDVIALHSIGHCPTISGRPLADPLPRFAALRERSRRYPIDTCCCEMRPSP
jgi:hypothetical protein